MIDSNQFLIDFIGNNWMAMVIIYSIFIAMFPNSTVLKAVGDSFSGLFPVFGKKPADDSAKKEEATS